jgi:hypothetical protein
MQSSQKIVVFIITDVGASDSTEVFTISNSAQFETLTAATMKNCRLQNRKEINR